MSSASPSLPSAAPSQAAAVRRGRRLEYFTIAWNVVEAGVSIAAGWVAGSTALLGFGVDAAIESSSGAALLWRLGTGADAEARERLALRFVGVSFFLLAAWVAVEAIRALIYREVPSRSYVGIGLAICSLVVMPLLARRKRAVAATLNSRALHSDAQQTSLCAYLSAILLGGLALNAVLGWWWADPVAGLAMVPILVNEGVEGFRGEKCDACAGGV